MSTTLVFYCRSCLHSHHHLMLRVCVTIDHLLHLYVLRHYSVAIADIHARLRSNRGAAHTAQSGLSWCASVAQRRQRGGPRSSPSSAASRDSRSRRLPSLQKPSWQQISAPRLYASPHASRKVSDRSIFCRLWLRNRYHHHSMHRSARWSSPLLCRCLLRPRVWCTKSCRHLPLVRARVADEFISVKRHPCWLFSGFMNVS